MKSDDERTVRWDLSADSVTSHKTNNILEAEGNVYLRRGDEYLKADFARYYADTNWVYLKGNVQVRMGKDELQANEAEFDLRSRVGWLKQGKIFIEGPHAYISGDRINKHWGDVYTFKQATVTTCDSDVPAWSITADEAILEVGGYARMRNSSFQIKNTPVAFAPFFLFPTKTTRQTGFLFPDFGRSSKKGFFYNQPFFWAIDESNDLTINEEFMDKRGFMHGVQFRTRPYSDTAGWIRFDWLNDRKTIKDGGGDPYPDLNRTNAERFWLRGMVDARLADPAWRFKADLDYVSDQDYLTDFKSGLSGFHRSQDELFSLFQRDLREKDQNRVSGALLTRDWERGSIAFSTQYTQNPRLGNGNTPRSQSKEVQRFPQFDAFLYKGRIFPSVPLEVEASAQAAYLYRKSGTRGARYTVAPRLTIPINGRYGSLIATGGLTQMFYNTEHPSHSAVDAPRGPRQAKDTKTVQDYTITASTEFARVFDLGASSLLLTDENVGQSQWTALKHTIQPRAEYRYRPLVDQDDNPFYDNNDRLMPTTELVYSITNTLTRKKEAVVLTKNEKGEMVPSHQTAYLDLLRLRVEQSFDHREETRNTQRDRYPRRPFGDVFSDLSLGINEYFSLSTRNNWSPYTNKLTRHQSGITVSVPEYGQVYAGYDLRDKLDEYKRYRNERLSYIRLDGSVNLWGGISVDGGLRYDTETLSNKEYNVRLAYNHQCFTLIGSCRVEPNEEAYQLMIKLTGLGD